MAMPIRISPNEGRAPDFWKPQTSGSTDSVSSGSLPSSAIPSTAEVENGDQVSHQAVFNHLNHKMTTGGEVNGVPPDISAALSYGLELVKYGAMLVATEGFPQVVNRTALTILGKKDGLSLAKTGLVADRASDTRLLLKLLKDAIQAPEKGEPKESPLNLPRKTARTSLVVRVFPGPGLECWSETDNRAALVMLYDRDMSLEVNPEVLSKLYGLTRGEAALAASLVRGKSIDEAAEDLFISPHTARTHLKRIFMKTDTHRQTELVMRIFPGAS